MGVLFYKGVRTFHMQQMANPIYGTWPGIANGGLKANMRNAFGGATQSSMATVARSASAADSTGLGICLTGDMDYAVDYIIDKFGGDGVLLLVRLTADHLPRLLADASVPGSTFANLKEAETARECTAMVDVPVHLISYAYASFTGQDPVFSPAAGYPVPAPRTDWDDDWMESA